MDGILLINKEKGITSRDVVNKVSKKLNIRRVGHAGTLDPIATGLMVIGVGKATKILDILTLDNKEYIATVKMGIQTDSLDITGNVTNKKEDFKISKDEILNVLNSFVGNYLQTVPKYSAVKINGKKLYEYARENKEIDLPKREVTIHDIELISFSNTQKEFKFRVLVSKGTYIRSLINDIGSKLNVPMTMKELVRTKCGLFDLKNSLLVNDEYKLISIKDCLSYKTIKLNEELLKKVKNGNIIELPNVNDVYVLLLDNLENELAIYKKTEFFKFKAFKVF